MESLNLKSTFTDTFKTIDECVTKICTYFSCPKLTEFEMHIELNDLTNRQAYLQNFNLVFKRLCSHLLEVSASLNKREKSYTD